MKMAKLAVVLDEWIEETGVVATAMQCWTSIEEFYGVAPCTVMSMMSNRLLPSACEVDITGAIGMYALTLATGVPAALLDWNNNYGDDPDKCVLFHCSNVPKACFSHAQMGCQDIVGSTVGFENAHGTCVGRIKPGPFTFVRVSTDDPSGRIRAYAGEGEFTEDPGDVWRRRRAHPDLQQLLHLLCASGFEHHVAIAHARVARTLGERWTTTSGGISICTTPRPRDLTARKPRASARSRADVFFASAPNLSGRHGTSFTEGVASLGVIACLLMKMSEVGGGMVRRVTSDQQNLMRHETEDFLRATSEVRRRQDEFWHRDYTASKHWMPLWTRTAPLAGGGR